MVSTVLERIYNPVNYYSNNNHYKWRGLIEIVSSVRNQLPTSTMVTTYKELRRTLKSSSINLCSITITHIETIKGNIFKLPSRWANPLSQPNLYVVNFPELRLMNVPFQVQILAFKYCPNVDITLFHHLLRSLLIIGSYVNNLKITSHLCYISLANCRVGTIIVPTNHYPFISTPVFRWRQCIFDCYDLNRYGNPDPLSNFDPLSEFSLEIPTLRCIISTYEAKRVITLLRSKSIPRRHSTETSMTRQVVCSPYAETNPINFTCTLASNPLRRASEYI